MPLFKLDVPPDEDTLSKHAQLLLILVQDEFNRFCDGDFAGLLILD